MGTLLLSTHAKVFWFLFKDTEPQITNTHTAAQGATGEVGNEALLPMRGLSVNLSIGH